MKNKYIFVVFLISLVVCINANAAEVETQFVLDFGNQYSSGDDLIKNIIYTEFNKDLNLEILDYKIEISKPLYDESIGKPNPNLLLILSISIILIAIFKKEIIGQMIIIKS